MTRPRAAFVATAAGLGLVAAAVVPLPAGAEPEVATADPRPFVERDVTVETYDYANAVRERVEVAVPGVDFDRDGITDQVTMDIIRPAEAAAAGVDVPVILLPSPYYSDNDTDFDADGTRINFPDWTDNYFVPRGYAVAMVDLPGTFRSTGCADVGGPMEVTGMISVVDWLNGRSPAHRPDGTPVEADWTNGKTAMMGTSWNGTIDNAVATSGVEGLETIVPIAAISSWYDYTRGYGAPYFVDHAGFLQEFISNDHVPFCEEMNQIVSDSAADETGVYNDWWAERNYRPDADGVAASVYLVHGLADENVKTAQYGRWWSELARQDVPRRIMLHQEQHVDGFAFRDKWVAEMHQWFDHWLHDLDNGAMAEPQALVMREDGSWTEQAVWPTPSRQTRLSLSTPSGTAAGGLSIGTGDAEPITVVLDGPGYAEYPRTADEVALDPTTERGDRAVFLSDELRSDVRWSGGARITLRVRSEQPLAGVGVRLVDYGTAERYVREGIVEGSEGSRCYGQGDDLDTGCYTDRTPVTEVSDVSVVSRMLASVNHHGGLQRSRELEPGRWYTLTFELQDDDVVFAAGHRFGLVLTPEHPNLSQPFDTVEGLQLTIDPARSSLVLPLTGGTRGLQTSTLSALTEVPGDTLDRATPESDPGALLQEMVEVATRVNP